MTDTRDLTRAAEDLHQWWTDYMQKTHTRSGRPMRVRSGRNREQARQQLQLLANAGVTPTVPDTLKSVREQ